MNRLDLTQQHEPNRHDLTREARRAEYVEMLRNCVRYQRLDDIHASDVSVLLEEIDELKRLLSLDPCRSNKQRGNQVEQT